MSEHPGLTAERLRELLNYDPVTGLFHWRVHRFRRRAGEQAGGVSAKGRLQIEIGGRCYQAPRLAWLHVTGEWPAGQIDHRDLNPLNNRLDNLREATNGQNAANRRSWNKHGMKGVTYREGLTKPWMAQIKHNGRVRNLGRFATKEEAHTRYVEEAEKLHGVFARTC